MKNRKRMWLGVVTVILMAMTPVQVTGQEVWVPIIGANNPHGGACLLKRFQVPARTVISGVKFVSNDPRTVFPKIALLRGSLSRLSEGAVLAEATNASATGEHRVEVSFPPTLIESGGEVYVCIAFPISNGVRGINDGDGIIGTPLGASDPKTSYFVSHVDEPFGPLDVDLRIGLVVQGAFKASGQSAEGPVGDGDTLPTVVTSEAHPNPFNPAVTIEFSVPNSETVELGIYNVSGRLVRTLLHETLSRGVYQRKWDGRDERGQKVASGIYISKLRVGRKVITQKLVLTK